MADVELTFHTHKIDGVEVFYREAGPRAGPAVLLLHGFPSSSRMWNPLIQRLADRYHVVAPDYPGFGHSSAPKPSEFTYTFDHLAEVIDQLTDRLGIDRLSLVMQDYGGPIGFRLALAHPERIQAMLVQNVAAHEEALGPPWEARRRFWADPAAHTAQLQKDLLSLQATRLRHVGKSPRPEKYDPDTWTDEFAFLSRPGQMDIQTALFLDYRTNVAAYPRWQAWLRERRPPLQVLWGRHDSSFEVAAGEAYRRDVPTADVHILDAGHFALDEAPDAVASLTRKFLDAVIVVPRIHRSMRNPAL